MESQVSASIIGKYELVENGRSYLLYTDADYRPCLRLSNNGEDYAEAIGATALSAATWYHVVGVYDGTDIRIYVDGALDENGSDNPKTYSSGIHDSATALELGHRVGASDYWDGLIDEAFIFNDALSEGEVLGIFQDGIQDVGISIPVVMWHLRQQGIS